MPSKKNNNPKGFLETLLRTIPHAIDVVDKEGNILYLNKALEQLVGKNALGKKCWGIYRDNKKQCKMCPLRKGVNINETKTMEVDKCFGGKSLIITHTGMVYKGKDAVLEVFTDITEQKKIEKQTHKQNKFLNSVIESLSHPFYVIDVSNHKILTANSSARLGFLKKDAICHATTHGSSQPCIGVHKCPLEEVKKTKKSVVVEHVHRDINNVARNVEVHAYPILDDKGNVTKMIEYCLDITDRKKAEAALKRANKKLKQVDKRKSEFVADVSHELRNPLGIIKESLSLVLDKAAGDINSKQEKILNLSFRSTNRLIRIVNNLLDISKIEEGKRNLNLEEVDLSSLLEEIIETYSIEFSKKSMALTKHTPLSSHQIWADKDAITEVIINLINNAIKYTPKKGKINISLDEFDKYVQFQITDSGPGIAKENHYKIFDKFERINTEAEEGTGLGLPITKELISLHKGEIWIESTPGHGSTFKFTIPKDIKKKLAPKKLKNKHSQHN